MDTIPIFKPSTNNDELTEIKKVLESGWLALGPKVKEFEDKFSDYTKAKYSVGFNSCTSSLEMALKLAGVGPGDEVIVPAMTFVSTAHAVVFNGAKPVFVDIDPTTLNLKLADVAKKINCKTKAIIPVHFGGRPVELRKLFNLCDYYNKFSQIDIKIIEDCAHAAGALYQNQHVGTFGFAGCFSFHAVKNMTTGDGGMLTLHDQDLAKRAAKLRWLGIDKDTWDRSEETKYAWEYSVDEIGRKCHMNDIAAAIGIVQLGKLDYMNKVRSNIAEVYTEELSCIPEIMTPPMKMGNSNSKSSWHLYFIKCLKRRDELMSYLKDHNIHTGVHYKPIHKYKCYNQTELVLPVAEKTYKQLLTLPIYPTMSELEQEYIIDTIRNFNFR